MAKPPTKNDVIKKYLNSDLDRFLKRVYAFSRYELIYSQVLPSYIKENKDLKNELPIIFKGEYPGQVAQVINVHRVMVKYYGFAIDAEDIKLCLRITQVLSSTIDKYNSQRYHYRIKNLYLTPHQCRPKQALKELIARGFIHINDFTGYDKRMAHIVSNNNVPLPYGKLYYPMNLTWDVWSKAKAINKQSRWWDFKDAYLTHGVIGVSGYTRVNIPQIK
jgi:hypothetical protein